MAGPPGSGSTLDVLKNITAKPGATVTFLGHDGPALQWKQDGGNLVITMPKVNPSRLPCKTAWTFKVSAVE